MCLSFSPNRSSFPTTPFLLTITLFFHSPRSKTHESSLSLPYFSSLIATITIFFKPQMVKYNHQQWLSVITVWVYILGYINSLQVGSSLLFSFHNFQSILDTAARLIFLIHCIHCHSPTRETIIAAYCIKYKL